MDIDEKVKEYAARREALVERNEKIKYGELEFSYAEELANQAFKKILQDQRGFLPEDIHMRWSMKYKNLIDKNAIYKIIQKMPKGALHHMHVDCSLDPEWVSPL